MNRLPDSDPHADDPLLALDDEPVDEWSLDDLDRSADLVSVRSAWTQGDDWPD